MMIECNTSGALPSVVHTFHRCRRPTGRVTFPRNWGRPRASPPPGEPFPLCLIVPPLPLSSPPPSCFASPLVVSSSLLASPHRLALLSLLSPQSSPPVFSILINSQLNPSQCLPSLRSPPPALALVSTFKPTEMTANLSENPCCPPGTHRSC